MAIVEIKDNAREINECNMEGNGENLNGINAKALIAKDVSINVNTKINGRPSKAKIIEKRKTRMPLKKGKIWEDIKQGVIQWAKKGWDNSQKMWTEANP